MHPGRFDDNIWDEHQWESHINEIERRGEQLRKFINSQTSDHKPRWYKLIDEFSSESDAVDAFVEEELSIDETYFPDDEDEWEDDDMDDFLSMDDEELMDLFEDEFLNQDDDEDDDDEDDLFGDEEDDFDAGEEWKELSPDYAMSDNGSIENLPVYKTSRKVSADILKWAHDNHSTKRPSIYFQFVNEVLQINTKLAAGYSFGFEQDLLGGNIAYNKKALNMANKALASLRSQKDAGYLSKDYYRYLHEELYELRNDIGIYIQELREQFYWGRL